MKEIEFISSGVMTTIQDLGRRKWRNMGVPLSGAADPESAALANALLGKNINSPVLESTFVGPKFKLHASQHIALVGAIMELKINGISAPHKTVITADSGSIVEIGRAAHGCRSYLAFRDNIIGTDFLGSVSTYLPSKLGGLKGRMIEKGDFISLEESDYKEDYQKAIETDKQANYSHTWLIRVTEGPEYDLLSTSSKDAIEDNEYLVDNDSNRIGIRLNGSPLEIDEHGDMISSPMFPGTIQCPANGQPIVLGPDAQTLGGYPRIFQVSKVDRSLIGQLRPGDQLRFKKISLKEAEELWRDKAISFPIISHI